MCFHLKIFYSIQEYAEILILPQEFCPRGVLSIIKLSTYLQRSPRYSAYVYGMIVHIYTGSSDVMHNEYIKAYGIEMKQLP